MPLRVFRTLEPFRDLQQDDCGTQPLVDCADAPLLVRDVGKGSPGAWISVGGTMSRMLGNPEQAHVRVEVGVGLDCTDYGAGTVVWSRDLYRDLQPGDTHVPVETDPAYVPQLPPGPYVVRVRAMGSGVLLPDDGFFVVAIDMDDDLI